MHRLASCILTKTSSCATPYFSIPFRYHYAGTTNVPVTPTPFISSEPRNGSKQAEDSLSLQAPQFQQNSSAASSSLFNHEVRCSRSLHSALLRLAQTAHCASQERSAVRCDRITHSESVEPRKEYPANSYRRNSSLKRGPVLKADKLEAVEMLENSRCKAGSQIPSEPTATSHDGTSVDTKTTLLRRLLLRQRFALHERLKSPIPDDAMATYRFRRARESHGLAFAPSERKSNMIPSFSPDLQSMGSPATSLETPPRSTAIWLQAFKLFVEAIQQRSVVPTIHHVNLLLVLAVKQCLWDQAMLVEDFLVRFLTSTIELRREKEDIVQHLLPDSGSPISSQVTRRNFTSPLGQSCPAWTSSQYVDKSPQTVRSKNYKPVNASPTPTVSERVATLFAEIRELNAIEAALQPNRQTFDLLMQVALSKRAWHLVLQYCRHSQNMPTSTFTESQVQGFLQAIRAIGPCTLEDLGEDSKQTSAERWPREGARVKKTDTLLPSATDCTLPMDTLAAWQRLFDVQFSNPSPTSGSAQEEAIRLKRIGLRRPSRALWQVAYDVFANYSTTICHPCTLWSMVHLLYDAKRTQEVLRFYHEYARELLAGHIPSGLGSKPDQSIVRTMLTVSKVACLHGDWVVALHLWETVVAFTPSFSSEDYTCGRESLVRLDVENTALCYASQTKIVSPVEGLVELLLLNALHALRRVGRYQAIINIYQSEREKQIQREGVCYATVPFWPPRAIVFVAQAAVGTRNLPLILELLQAEGFVQDAGADASLLVPRMCRKGNVIHSAEVYDAALRLIQIQSIEADTRDCCNTPLLTPCEKRNTLSLSIYALYTKSCMRAIEEWNIYDADAGMNKKPAQEGAGRHKGNTSEPWRRLLTTAHMPLLSMLYEVSHFVTSQPRGQRDPPCERDGDRSGVCDHAKSLQTNIERMARMQRDALAYFEAVRRPDTLVVALLLNVLRFTGQVSRTTADAIMKIFGIAIHLPIQSQSECTSHNKVGDTSPLAKGTMGLSLTHLTAVAAEFAYEVLRESYPFAALAVINVALKYKALNSTRAVAMVAALQSTAELNIQTISTGSKKVEPLRATCMPFEKTRLLTPSSDHSTLVKRWVGHSVAMLMVLFLLCNDAYTDPGGALISELTFQTLGQDDIMHLRERELIQAQDHEGQMNLRNHSGLVEKAVIVMHHLESASLCSTDVLHKLICHLSKVLVRCVPKASHTQRARPSTGSSFPGLLLSTPSSIKLQRVVITVVNAVLGRIALSKSHRCSSWPQCLDLLQMLRSPFTQEASEPEEHPTDVIPSKDGFPRSYFLADVSTLHVLRCLVQQCDGTESRFVEKLVLAWLLPCSLSTMLAFIPQDLYSREAEFAHTAYPSEVRSTWALTKEGVLLLFEALVWACQNHKRNLVDQLLMHVRLFALDPLIQLSLTSDEDALHRSVGSRKGDLGSHRELQIFKNDLQELQSYALETTLHVLECLSSARDLAVLEDWELLRTLLLQLHEYACSAGTPSSSPKERLLPPALLNRLALVLVELQQALVFAFDKILKYTDDPKSQQNQKSFQKSDRWNKFEAAAREYMQWCQGLFLSQHLVPTLSTLLLDLRQASGEGNGKQRCLELYCELRKSTRKLLNASWEVLSLIFHHLDSIQSKASEHIPPSRERRSSSETIEELAEHANRLLLIQGQLLNGESLNLLSADGIEFARRVEIWCVLRMCRTRTTRSCPNKRCSAPSPSCMFVSPVESLCHDVGVLDSIYRKFGAASNRLTSLDGYEESVKGSEMKCEKKIQMQTPCVCSISLQDGGDAIKCTISNPRKGVQECGSDLQLRHLLQVVHLVANCNFTDNSVYTASFALCFVSVVHAITSYVINSNTNIDIPSTPPTQHKPTSYSSFSRSATTRNASATMQKFTTVPLCAKLRASELRILHAAALRLCYIKLCEDGPEDTNRSGSGEADIKLFLPWALAWAAPSPEFYNRLLDAMQFFRGGKIWGRYKHASAFLAETFHIIAAVDQWYRTHAESERDSNSTCRRAAFYGGNGTLLLSYLLQRPTIKSDGLTDDKKKNLSRDATLRPGSLLDETVVASAFVCLAPSLGGAQVSPPLYRARLFRSGINPTIETAFEHTMSWTSVEDNNKIYSLLLAFPLVVPSLLLPWWRQGRLTPEQVAGIDHYFARFISPFLTGSLPPAEIPTASPTLRRNAITWFLVTRGSLDCCSEITPQPLIPRECSYGSSTREDYDACLRSINEEGNRLFVEILQKGPQALLSRVRKQDYSPNVASHAGPLDIMDTKHALDGMSLENKGKVQSTDHLHSYGMPVSTIQTLLRSTLTQRSASQILSECFPDVQKIHTGTQPSPASFPPSKESRKAQNFPPRRGFQQTLPALGDAELTCLISITSSKLTEEVKNTLRSANMLRRAENGIEHNPKERRVSMRPEPTQAHSTPSKDEKTQKSVHEEWKPVTIERSFPRSYWITVVLKDILRPTEYDQTDQASAKGKEFTHAHRHLSRMRLKKSPSSKMRLERILATSSPVSKTSNGMNAGQNPAHQELGVKSWKDVFCHIRAEMEDLERYSRDFSSDEAIFYPREFTQLSSDTHERLEEFMLHECHKLYVFDKNVESLETEARTVPEDDDDALWMLNSVLLCLDIVQKGRALSFVISNIYPMCSLVQTAGHRAPLPRGHSLPTKSTEYASVLHIRLLRNWSKFVKHHMHGLIFQTPLLERLAQETQTMAPVECNLNLTDYSRLAFSAGAMQRITTEPTKVTHSLIAILRLLALESCLFELDLEKLLRKKGETHSLMKYRLRILKDDWPRIRCILRELYAVVCQSFSPALLDSDLGKSVQSSLACDVVRSGLQIGILLGAWKDLQWLCHRLMLSSSTQQSKKLTRDEVIYFWTQFLLPVSIAALFASLSRPSDSWSFSSQFRSFVSSSAQHNPDKKEYTSNEHTMVKENDLKVRCTGQDTVEQFLNLLSELEVTLKKRIATVSTQASRETEYPGHYITRLAHAQPLEVLFASLRKFAYLNFTTKNKDEESMHRFHTSLALLIHPIHAAELWRQSDECPIVNKDIINVQKENASIGEGNLVTLSKETVQAAISCLVASLPSDFKAFIRLESKLFTREKNAIVELKSRPCKSENGGKAIQEAWSVLINALLHHPHLLTKQNIRCVFLSLKHIPHTKHFIPLVLSKAAIEACSTFKEALGLLRMSLRTLPHNGATVVQHHMCLLILEKLCYNAKWIGRERLGITDKHFSQGLDQYTYIPSSELWLASEECSISCNLTGAQEPQVGEKASLGVIQPKKGLVAVVCTCHDLLYAYKEKIYKGNNCVKKYTSARRPDLVPQHLLVRLLYAAASDLDVTLHIYKLFWTQPYHRVEGVKVFLSALRAARLSCASTRLVREREYLAVSAMLDFLFLSSGVVKVVTTQFGMIPPTPEVTQRSLAYFSEENHKVLWHAFVASCRCGAISKATASQMVATFKNCNLINEIEELLVSTLYDLKEATSDKVEAKVRSK